MMSTLCNIWDKFSRWVSYEWSNLTFILVVCALLIMGLLAFLSFFKKSINKDKRPKWGLLVLAIVMFALAAVLFAANRLRS